MLWKNEGGKTSKHDNDTYFFLYYTIKVDKRDYWVNVKMHKDLGEVIYTIEKEKPKDLIRGHKKKWLRKRLFLRTWVARITSESPLQKYKKFQYQICGDEKKLYFRGQV